MALARAALGVLVAVLLSSISVAGDYSARTHFYAVEYLKPVAGMDDLTMLNVTFNRQLDAETAERVLREELGRVVSLFPPKGDVMAYAWTETNLTPGSEEKIPLRDGSDFLIYSPKTKQTQTAKEYDVAKQKPVQPGKGINVELSLELEKGSDGRARILGRTNLPHGMSLMFDIRRAGSKFFAQDHVEVVDGQLVSPWFSDGGKPLPAGAYTIEVSSPLPNLEPPAVRDKIGKSGENLVGPVRTWMGYKMIEYKTTATLK